MADFKDILLQKEINNLDVVPMKVVDLLAEKKLTLSVAESITGGDICANLVKIPGVSKQFIGGIIAYSNLVKVNECNVLPKTIQLYGAVSSQVSLEMALGIQKKFHTNVSLATTGFAGPKIDNEKVGLVYISIVINKVDYTKQFIFKGDRNEIITQTTFNAFELLRYYISR
ncbi:MAG: hypothetical protein A2Y40_00775 [Candidatus Margulisbacteria bacterium GWF2_35_9]|nr:MAG: hypothetical protein A2Y40_00775 [Candidatus Margulisbacteria bacterium GWF2_35_9]